MKDQQKKMFYIKKQLTCNNIPEIIEGIEKARQFFSQVTLPQFLSNVVLQLLDLFISTKICYIKSLIADTISISFPPSIASSSNPLIVSKLTQCLISNDQILRILSLKMITHLYNLFEKDSSVYHHLLSKLSRISQQSTSNQQPNKKQIVKTLICLRTLLQNSENLSSIFSNNLRELKELGGIHIKFILYLCLYAKFEPRSYENIIKILWQVLDSEKSLTTKINRKYFLMLLKKGCQRNYKCATLYFDSLQQYFPELRDSIKKIKISAFSFLGTNNYENIDFYSHVQLLDFCYQQNSIFCQIPPQVQPVIESKIMQDISSNKINSQTLLLSFYLVSHDTKFEEAISQQYVPEQRTLKQNYRFLKIALVCAKYTLASKIIQYLMNTTMQQNGNHTISALLLFLAYTQLHSKPDMNNFLTFVILLTNLSIGGKHHHLYTLAKLWRAYYQKKYEGDLIIEDQQLLEYQSKTQVSDMSSEKTKIKCSPQLQIMQSNFSENRLPLCQESKRFSKIYFTKQTILDIFKYI